MSDRADFGWYRSPVADETTGDETPSSASAGQVIPANSSGTAGPSASTEARGTGTQSERSDPVHPPQPGWWRAADGNWYPPEHHPDFTQRATAVGAAPAPGWWLASDGNWYPPEQHPDRASQLATTPPAPGWWQATDGNWYPPEQHPDAIR